MLVRLSLVLLIVLILAGLGFTYAPKIVEFAGGEKSLIRFERNQRRLRADLGLPMPGQPDLAKFSERLSGAGLSKGDPVLIRIFKREFELELWMQRDGTYRKFATYPICRWSGKLGPKLREGDQQAPEGFYTVDQTALNPNSKWFRSFNLGYPNTFDRTHGRTGSFIMVHGGCASIGCFAMTNGQMQEIWTLVTAALAGPQKRFQVQVYPFRMSAENMESHADHPDIDFWKSLKAGNDLFEASFAAPKVTVCQGRYTFEAGKKGTPAADEIAEICSGEPPKS